MFYLFFLFLQVVHWYFFYYRGQEACWQIQVQICGDVCGAESQHRWVVGRYRSSSPISAGRVCHLKLHWKLTEEPEQSSQIHQHSTGQDHEHRPQGDPMHKSVWCLSFCRKRFLVQTAKVYEFNIAQNLTRMNTSSWSGLVWFGLPCEVSLLRNFPNQGPRAKVNGATDQYCA